MDLGKRFQELRKQKNISAYRVSKESGISTTHIRDIERGVKIPTVDTLYRMLAPFDISLAEFFNENGDAFYLSPNEQEVVKCYRELPPEKAELFLQFLKSYRN